MQKRLKIAVIGTGVAGLGAAWLLSKAHDVTLYEKNGYAGGHTNTFVTPGGKAVDTGFIVYNPDTYPNFVALMSHLGVATQESVMSFAVSLDGGALEYSGDNLNTLFVQRRNLLNPRFHRMWMDIVRFYYEAPRALARAPDSPLTLGEFLKARKYSDGLVNDHLLPMGAAIWSMTREGMLDFPFATFVRFCINHGLLRLVDRPVWRTVSGGSKTYVAKLLEGLEGRLRKNCAAVKLERGAEKPVILDAAGRREGFDEVVVAAHADEALALLAQPSAAEREVLSAVRYSSNRAVLHQDESLMPKNRKAWASWTYLGAAPQGVSLIYWMNRLQNLPQDEQFFVSLNPAREPQRILYETGYAHPVYTRGVVEAQRRLGAIQGANHTWFCGAWCGYGFHEDALASGLAVAEHFGVERPWQIRESSTAAQHARKAA
jgi:predicted NAD/FAD-binding protein